jgi:hypothetical protein
MLPRDAQLRQLADALVAELLKKDLLTLAGDPDTLRERFFVVLSKNFAEEAALERDAEAFAQAHRREMVGLDSRKVLTLVKERLAKERGFVL